MLLYDSTQSTTMLTQNNNYAWILLKNTFVKSKKTLVFGLLLLILWWKWKIHRTNKNNHVMERQGDNPTITEWSSLHLVDPQGNTINTMQLINKTFFSSGYPSLMKNIKWET